MSSVLMHVRLKMMELTMRKIETSFRCISARNMHSTMQIGRALENCEINQLNPACKSSAICCKQSLHWNWKLFIIIPKAESANWMQHGNSIFGQFQIDFTIQWNPHCMKVDYALLIYKREFTASRVRVGGALKTFCYFKELFVKLERHQSWWENFVEDTLLSNFWLWNYYQNNVSRKSF
jgi:hypothetical protein